MANEENLLRGNPKTQFSSTNQPKNNGRRKNIYNILKESGYSSDDIKSAFGELAWYSENEIQEVIQDKDKPVIMKVVAKAYENAVKQGDFRYVKDILEQFMGKATLPIEQKGEVEKVKNVFVIGDQTIEFE